MVKKLDTDQEKKATSHLKIYRADKNEEGEWSNITELPFNSNYYSTGHPALSPDESHLVFYIG